MDKASLEIRRNGGEVGSSGTSIPVAAGGQNPFALSWEPGVALLTVAEVESADPGFQAWRASKLFAFGSYSVLFVRIQLGPLSLDFFVLRSNEHNWTHYKKDMTYSLKFS